MGRLDDNIPLKTMVVFRKAERTLDAQSSGVFKKHSITPTQFSVLEVLHTKGEMSISQLINSVLATSGNMTVVLKNMERNGWIFRHQADTDKRSFVIELTDQGRQLIEKVLPEHVQHVEETMSVLTHDEQLQLIDLLKKFKTLQ